MKALIVLEDYIPKPHEIKRPVDEEYLPALAEGLLENNIQPIFMSIKPDQGYNLQDFHFAVFWGQRHHAYKEVRRQLPTLTFELPFLGTADEGWFSLGWDGLNGTANFCVEDVCDHRRLTYWQNSIKPWKTNEDKGDLFHLLIGQVHGDMSLEGKDINVELERLLLDINRCYPKEFVVFRPHPKAVEDYTFYSWSEEKCKQHNLVIDTQHSLTELFYYALSCVTYSSNTAVESVLYGIPTVAVGNCSMAKEVTFNKVHSRYDVSAFNRLTWLNKLAYSQWNLYEIKRGLFWKTLSRYKRLGD